MRSKIRQALVQGSDAISRRFAYGRTTATLERGVLSFDDYQYRPMPRFGRTRPPLPWLSARLEAQEQRLSASLEICVGFADELARIPLSAPEQSREPRWLNPWMSGLDAAWLYSVARSQAPALFLEIGSGNSTKFVRRGIEDGGARTRLVSIDPHPRAEIDDLCDEVHRSALEDTPLSVFQELAPGDVLFFDGSHRALQNSDVTVFFLEILPILPRGVLVGIHDIFLPYDYPDEWTARLYNEQHMLAAYLLGCSETSIGFAAYWISRTERFDKATNRIFHFDRQRQIQRHGGCFFWTS